MLDSTVKTDWDRNAEKMKEKFVEELEGQPTTEIATHRENGESAEDRQDIQESKRDMRQKTEDSGALCHRRDNSNREED